MDKKKVFNFPKEAFDHHLPDEEQLVRIPKVREAFAALREVLDEFLASGTCSGRYAALCGTSLEEACMWAIKSIVFEKYNAG